MGTFLVTGSSTGIGAACVLRLAQGGHRVYAGVRRAEDGERLVAEAGERLVPVLLDVTDVEQIEAVAARIDADTGPGGLDGLVNNAGIARGGPVELLPLEEWRRQLEVNVLGQVAVTKAMIPLVRRARGRIVFMGSMAGRVSVPFIAPYGASKHAIEAIGESLREELRPWGISVSVVEPGAIRTPIWGKGRAFAAELEAAVPELRTRYAEQVDKVLAGIETSERTGIPADRVAEVVERALTGSRPRYRYLVGTDAKAVGVLDRFLPDRALATLTRRLAP